MVSTRARSLYLHRLFSGPRSRQLIQQWLQLPDQVPILQQETIIQDLLNSTRSQAEFCKFLLEFVQKPECQGSLLIAFAMYSCIGEDVDKMIKHIAQLFDVIVEEDDFIQLGKHDLLEIIQSPFLFVQWESSILIALQRWIANQAERARNLSYFLPFVQWARWTPFDSIQLDRLSAELQQSAQQCLSSSAVVEPARYRSIEMAIPIPDRVFHQCSKQFHMATYQWESHLLPDPYQSSAPRFYRLRLCLLSGPASTTFPLRIRILPPCSKESLYDTEWNRFGDVQEIPVFPIHQLGNSFVDLVVDDQIQIEFRLEFRL